VIGSGFALAGLILIGSMPAKSIHVADKGQDSPGFYREVIGGRLMSIKPLAAPLPDHRPARSMSEEDLQRLEFEKSRSGVRRLPDKDEREFKPEVASDPRPVRVQTEQRTMGQENNRAGRRLVHRPAPEQGTDEVEVIR